MQYAICLGLFLPLIGFLVLLATSNRIGRQLAGIFASINILISFLCFIGIMIVYNNWGSLEQKVNLFSWIPIDGINANFSLHLDPLSHWMTFVVTGVGFLIHVYSIGYMDHEEDYARYFAFLNLFIFFMLLLVLGGNILVLFLGWEGVGLASYLLIGYWYTRPSAAQAAVKAFVINRIGDLGLLLGILLTFYIFGTGEISEINARAPKEFQAGTTILTVLTLLYFVGAVGKSAQLPLYTWLPDAMEGPTPVSALIHAATMVTAGVYLIVRMHEVFLLAPLTMQVIGVVGGVTSLFAALCAVGQVDLKRVLAYSTVSQLGLMFLATGVGAFYAAMFHLTTHAFVKALLFLSAGNVVHMMHGTTMMDKMGGLSKIFTRTHWMFLIGVLALSGIPPLAAFFSKDLILEEEHLYGFQSLYIIGLLTSILTGFYLTRAYCLAFTGKTRTDKKLLKEVKEAPGVMLVPVSILALLSLIGGFLGFAFDKTPLLESFLQKIGLTLAEKEFGTDMLFAPETWIAISGAVLSVGSAALIYTRYYEKLGSTFTLLTKSFYVDEFYSNFICRPLDAISRTIDYVIEPKLFDGSISGVVHATQGVSRWLQGFQSGQVRSYVAWMVIGTVLLIAYFAF